jgi:hypothetical protein
MKKNIKKEKEVKVKSQLTYNEWFNRISIEGFMAGDYGKQYAEYSKNK